MNPSRNAFIGRSAPPAAADLSKELGALHPLWEQLTATLSREFNLECEWNSYSPKAGWALRLQRAGRNILYLSPRHGAFGVSFALGGKALAAVRAAGLPASVLKSIDQARRYAEGTAVRLDIATPADIEIVRKLTAAKIAN